MSRCFQKDTFDMSLCIQKDIFDKSLCFSSIYCCICSRHKSSYMRRNNFQSHQSRDVLNICSNTYHIYFPSIRRSFIIIFTSSFLRRLLPLDDLMPTLVMACIKIVIGTKRTLSQCPKKHCSAVIEVSD